MRLPFLRGRIYALMVEHKKLTPRQCADMLGHPVGPTGHAMARMVPKWLTLARRGRRTVYVFVEGSPVPVDGRGVENTEGLRRHKAPAVLTSWKFERTALEEVWPLVANGKGKS